MIPADQINKINKANLPKHIAFSIHGVEEYAKNNNLKLNNAVDDAFSVVEELVKSQTELDIPIFTFYVLNNENKKQEFNFSSILDGFVRFITSSDFNNLIRKYKIKTTFLGKWYDLPDYAVNAIKKILDETKEYDSFFLNFCINYSGKGEIIDAVKLIAKNVEQRRISSDSIDQNYLKENLYSSYFIPPELYLIIGNKNKNSGLLLWDSENSSTIFISKPFPDFNREEFMKVIKRHQLNLY